MQGLGRKIVPMVSSGIELLGKLIVAWVLAAPMGYFGIIISEPATWILCTVLLSIAFFTDDRIRRGSQPKKEKIHETD